MDFIRSEYRGLPFWSWNGKLDKAEIIRQVHVMKKMGFGGFFMHSRTGLETEYLGEEWFDLIRAASGEAEKLGLTAWLYDEDRWPSGTAGGEVTKKKEYQQKFFSMYDTLQSEYSAIKNDENLLNVFAVKLSDQDEIIDYYVYNGGDLLDGYTLKKVVFEYMQPQDFYNGYTYLDTLSLDATNAFIQSTHQKYKEKCGDLFGKQIMGIFTDEPHRGAIMNGFGINNDNKMNMLPATYTTCEEFFKACGYSLKDRLIELYYLPHGETANKTMFDYIGVTQNMFINNFAKPYHDWCKANKLIFTGHVLHEDSLAIQTVFQGSVQRFYEFMDYPGVDILTEGNNAYWVAKQVQSVARQLNKPFVLSELYGATGWQMNFESHRDVGNWQALFGINLRCHHLSWYTMEGESKRDYPASILHQSGWYSDYSYIEDYFARANQILSSGEAVVDTLVINPVESVWLYPKKGWLKDLFSPTVPQVRQIDHEYLQLFNALTTNQIDFDYGDEDIISRHYSINIDGGKAILRVGSSTYTTVILSANHTIRQSTLNILSDFITKGGKVICVGEKPTRVNGVSHANILPQVKSIGINNIASELCDNSFFTASGNLFSATRKVGGDYYAVILNPNREAGTLSKITFKDAFCVTEIRLESGEESLQYLQATTFETFFDKGEMRVFKLSGKPQEQMIKPQYSRISEYEINKAMPITLSEGNVLPLDMPKFAFRNVKYESMEILQADRKIREFFGLKYRAGEMIQPWYRKKYLKQDKKHAEKLELSHSFFVEELPQRISLVMEQSELYTILVNGKKLDTTVKTAWIDVCFDKITLDKNLLIIGENIITLQVDFDEDVNLEAIYLVGDFGVKITGDVDKTIIAMPKTLQIGDITNQGLPFYSGSISYHTGIYRGSVTVTLGGCYGALAKITDGKTVNCVAFAPYKSQIISLEGELIIQVALTRRNTFGPLHLKGVLSGAYGPEHFVMQECQQKEYSLIGQGLLAAPKITMYN